MGGIRTPGENMITGSPQRLPPPIRMAQPIVITLDGAGTATVLQDPLGNNPNAEAAPLGAVACSSLKSITPTYPTRPLLCVCLFVSLLFLLLLVRLADEGAAA